MKRYLAKLRRNKAAKCKRAISNVISTIILTGVLLIILVVASFVSLNILSAQMASTEFEQAKTNMCLLDGVIQDVALRRGAGGYVQFNERTGGVGLNQTTDNIAIYAAGNPAALRQWSSLNRTVYRAGSQTSGASTTLKGTSKLNVSMSESISFLRVEVGPGLWIKLDYNRLRTVSIGTLIANNSAYNFYSITFIQLIKGSITASSGTVDVRVQNLDIRTNSYVYENGVNLTAKLNNGTATNLVLSPNKPTVVMITEIPILVSIG